MGLNQRSCHTSGAVCTSVSVLTRGEVASRTKLLGEQLVHPATPQLKVTFRL